MADVRDGALGQWLGYLLRLALVMISRIFIRRDELAEFVDGKRRLLRVQHGMTVGTNWPKDCLAKPPVRQKKRRGRTKLTL